MQAIKKLKFLTVLFYILGGLGLLPLLLVLYIVVLFSFDPGASKPESWPQALFYGTLLLVIGLLPILVAILLSKRKKLGRTGALLIGAIMIVAAASEIVSGFTASDTTKVIGNLVALVVPALIILLAYPRDVAALLQDGHTMAQRSEQQK